MKITNNILILPKATIDVYQLLINSGKNDDDAKKMINSSGIHSLSYSNNYLLSEFIFNGILNINKFHRDIFTNIDAIIVVSQSYDQRLPSISTRIQKKLNLNENTFCIDLMDGCCGYIKALSLASMLEKQGYKKILLLTGDLNSKMTGRSEIGTKILFGDGISLNILEKDRSIIDTQIFNSGDNNDMISCKIKDNILNIKAFEVFMFARNTAPKIINSYLLKRGKSLNSYELIGLHQASKMIVSTIFKKIGYKNTLVDDFACNTIGNIGAGSVGAWMSNIKELKKKGKLNMLAVGFGSGLSWGLASVVVDVKNNEVIYI